MAPIEGCRIIGAMGIVACVFASCAATISFDGELRSELKELPALPVALLEDLKTLTEFDTTQGLPTTYEIGKLLSRFFDGQDMQVALSKVNSRLDVTTSSQLIIFTKWNATYMLSVSLQHPNGVQVLSGVGTGRADDLPGASRRAAKAAIEDCVLDVYKQAYAIIKTAATSSVSVPAPTH